MEAVERPMKYRKLSHGGKDQQPSQDEFLSQILPGDVVEDDEERPLMKERTESADITDADPSDPNIDSASSVPTYSTPLLPTSDVAHSSSLSKSQLKKLRKKQAWEAGRAERRIIRKQKNRERKARKRAARVATTDPSPLANGEAIENGGRDSPGRDSLRPGVPKHASGTLLPITLIVDCAFDDLMHEKERTSLASQITRCYSDNHRAPFKAHLAISSWGGELKARFETILNGNYKNWRGVRMLEEDFVQAAEWSKEWMLNRDKGGKLAGAFATDARLQCEHSPQELENQGEVVYLTSDSENTLDRLKPYSTYIIGGLVDKNRHKGACYKKACDKGVRTAKLPIGEYMEMQSRFVLTTNHVVEIMVRWLDCGDWSEA